jgi:hypothetical protein
VLRDRPRLYEETLQRPPQVSARPGIAWETDQGGNRVLRDRPRLYEETLQRPPQVSARPGIAWNSQWYPG